MRLAAHINGAAGACAVAAILFCGCRDRQDVERVNWQTMGTVAAVQTRDDRTGAWTGRFAAETMGVFKDVESLLNAHSTKSEISLLAPLPAENVLKSCAKEMRPCYAAAFALCDATGGAFNPRWRGAGTLDFGAIAKGFAVDLAADACARQSPPGALLIDLGGNLKSVKGTWRTGVKDPGGDGFAAAVELREGEALATSATYYRGGHIHDGRTGGSVTNDVVSVTVLATSAMWADGLSTTLFVLGPDEGRDFLARHQSALCGDGVTAVLWILRGGRTVAADPSRRFVLP